MITLRTLRNVLADSLGLECELVKAHARALHEAGRLPIDDTDQISSQHAAALLIALMTVAPPEKVSNAERLYAGLPLDGANTATFGAILERLIRWFNEALETDFEVAEIALGGGPGTARAIIYYTYFTDRGEVPRDVSFSLEPFGAGYRPDDAPSARLDHYSVVPGTIFFVLREASTGNENRPSRILVPYADLMSPSEQGMLEGARMIHVLPQ